ncbi:MAG: ribosomal-protein-alanine N-acetyltransferase [Actinomycetota bacterium]|jgi:ribosomal-protein-alanine N-acetyltransferase
MALQEDEIVDQHDDNDSLVISTMRRRHLRSVLRIEEQTSSTPWSLGLFLSEARRPERVYLVAKKGKEIVGFAGMLFALNEGHITTIAVDPAYQGARIGTRLMLVLMRRAIAHGSDCVTLEVRASNTSAKRMYARFGFMPAGTRTAYYKDPVEDAMVYWAYDVDSENYHKRLVEIERSLYEPFIYEHSEWDTDTDDQLDEVDGEPNETKNGYL